MKHSRRQLALLPLLAGAASSQESSMPSRSFRFEDLPVRTNGENRSRAVLDGKLRTGFPIELHLTELAPGLAPHPPHRHMHEEMIMIRDGILEVTIAGKVTRLGPGSVAFVASGEDHGWKNAGSSNAHYFVLALGQKQK